MTLSPGVNNPHIHGKQPTALLQWVVAKEGDYVWNGDIRIESLMVLHQLLSIIIGDILLTEENGAAAMSNAGAAILEHFKYFIRITSRD